MVFFYFYSLCSSSSVGVYIPRIGCVFSHQGCLRLKQFAHQFLQKWTGNHKALRKACHLAQVLRSLLSGSARSEVDPVAANRIATVLHDTKLKFRLSGHGATQQSVQRQPAR